MNYYWRFSEQPVLLRLRGGLHTLIDWADLDLVLPFRWWLQHTSRPGRFYCRGSTRPTKDMHRFLLGPDPVPSEPWCGLHADHINGDGLDNRRSVNLRLVTRVENMRNRTGGPGPLERGLIPFGVAIIDISQRAE